MKLVVAPLDAPVTWDGSAAGGMTRPPRFGAPRADTNPGFQVSRSIFDGRITWASSSSPSHPRTPWVLPRVTGPFSAVNRGPLFRRINRTPRKAMVLLRWLTGPCSGINPRYAFSMQTVRAVLSRARALRAITRSAPARPPKGGFLTSLGGGKLQLRRCHHQFTSVLRAVP